MIPRDLGISFSTIRLASVLSCLVFGSLMVLLLRSWRRHRHASALQKPQERPCLSPKAHPLGVSRSGPINCRPWTPQALGSASSARSLPWWPLPPIRPIMPIGSCRPHACRGCLHLLRVGGAERLPPAASPQAERHVVRAPLRWVYVWLVVALAGLALVLLAWRSGMAGYSSPHGAGFSSRRLCGAGAGALSP